jgi:hypothetical protein
MPFTPKDKNAGDVLKSQDWNAGMQEILRLDKEKVDRKGDTITGSLTIGDALTVMGNTTLSAGAKDTVSVLSLKGQLSKGIAATIVLQNSAGGAGGGGSLDFNGYDVNPDAGKRVPTARIQSIDNGDYSSHLGFYTKASGNVNQLHERLRIASNGNVGIGTSDVKATLQVIGTANITTGEGQNFANKGNYMAPGSLAIGGIDQSYGGGQFWHKNTAGLLLETLDNTEIAVHDSGLRLSSFMYYSSISHQFTIGRDMGYGPISKVEIAGTLTVNQAITPSAGNAETAGIMFPKDPGGGSSDSAWIRYYRRGSTGEACTLEIGMANDPDDHITLNTVGNIGVGINSPIAKLDIQSVVRNGTHPAVVKGLYVTGDFGPDSDGIEFRHTNGTQGIGFGHNTIYATGNSSDQDLGLKPKGNGQVNITANLQIRGTVKTRLDVIQCLGKDGWNDRTHPVAAYFRGKLTGEPAGTMMMAICDLSGWERIVWQGYVSSNGQIWVNHLNWVNANANVIGP